MFEKVFEADPVIKFTYAWNRLNVYRQRVYGVTTAIVKVGYQYSDCKDTIWDVQTTKLSGHDMSISDVGGWNLDIHHRYNFHEGKSHMFDNFVVKLLVTLEIPRVSIYSKFFNIQHNNYFLPCNDSQTYGCKTSTTSRVVYGFIIMPNVSDI